MPDWTYHTIFKPVLKRLPYQTAQGLVFRSMGLLSTSPPGRAVIQLMGHGAPKPHMEVDRGEFRCAAPTALGAGVDLECRATSALALFGFGLIEVGPVGENPTDQRPEWFGPEAGITTVDNAVIRPNELSTRLKNTVRDRNVHVVARIAQGANVVRIAEQLLSTTQQLQSTINAVSVHHTDAIDPTTVDCDVFIRVRADEDVSNLPPATGLILEQHDMPLDVFTNSLRRAREVIGSNRVLIADTGIAEPADAAPLATAGADLIMIRSGIAQAGPGLPKRINRVLAARPENEAESWPTLFSPQSSFFWSALMGLALFVGGVIAVLLGSTRVLLPYDEEYLGMLRAELCGFNENIIPFMSHDRVTLAGTMLSLGVLYLGASLCGERRGEPWVRTAWITSSIVGFFSFFTFLGFGYFDPFHAFIAAILFQFILMGLRSPIPTLRQPTIDLRNDRAWFGGLWGQLLFVVHGAAILLAGIVISSFGVTTVFVAEDLEFMKITGEELLNINPRLVPLVAHDRASFGGMLMSTGVMVLLCAMWGWRRGQRWLWYSLAASGTMAYGATIVIHWAVGYTSLKHLLPAYGGLIALWLGLVVSRRWLCDRSPQNAVPATAVSATE